MNKSMNYRIYGIVGIESTLANWNADFTGSPRTTDDGRIYGSDKAFKYSVRHLWKMKNKNLLIYKELEISKGKLKPKTLDEKYLGQHKKIEDSKSLLTNLFNYIDVKNFGVAFAVKTWNVSITGAVQVAQGFNILSDRIIDQEILSPFASAEEKGQSTKGINGVAEHCLYVYPLVINPGAYNEYVELGVTDGYTEDDYNEFKYAVNYGATMLNSASKVGCKNSFSVYIKTNKDKYLPPLDKYVEASEEGNSLNITISISQILDKDDEVELYYNNLKDTINIDVQCSKFNIITGEIIE